MLNKYHFTTDGENVVCTRDGETRTYKYKHKKGYAFYVRKTFIGSCNGIDELLECLNDPFWCSFAEQIWETTIPIKTVHPDGNRMELATEQRDAIVIPLANVIEETAGVDYWEAKDELTHLLEFGTVDEWDQAAARAIGEAVRAGYRDADLGGATRAFAIGRGYITKDPGLMAALSQAR